MACNVNVQGRVQARELQRETAGQRANRIIAEELLRRGWTPTDSAARRRSDPGELAMAARLRSETTLPVKWIAARVQIGTTKGAKFSLHHLAHGPAQHRPARLNKAYAQLEFQSAFDSFPGSYTYEPCLDVAPTPDYESVLTD